MYQLYASSITGLLMTIMKQTATLLFQVLFQGVENVYSYCENK